MLPARGPRWASGVRRWALAPLVVLAIAGKGCAMEPPDIEEVLDARRDAIMRTPGVTGVGLGRCDGEPCIKVYTEDARPELEARLGELLGDTPYAVEVSGTFRARPPTDG